jgi:hypothetical protein
MADQGKCVYSTATIVIIIIYLSKLYFADIFAGMDAATIESKFRPARDKTMNFT